VSIRTKLLVFLPLFMLLANAIAFFLYQNQNVTQQSYRSTMDRILLYNQTGQAAERHLQALFQYLAHPGADRERDVEASAAEAADRRAALDREAAGFADPAVRAGFAHLLDTLTAQSADALRAGRAASPEEALRQYEQAERTLSFLREDGLRLIDMELAAYVPVFAGMQREIAKLNALGVYVFILNTALSVVVAIWISRSVTVPVSRLVRMAEDFSKGNWNEPPRLANRADGEMGLLLDVFRRMQKDVTALMAGEKAGLEKERLVKELELQALQSQINPHFLFNTLNVISKLALLEGAGKTSDLIVSVSQLLRYNLRRLDRPATLREEIRHVQQYIAIQQARFRDKVTFVSDIDESVLDVALPSLTIQPIVENAFAHGVEGKESGAAIKLRVRPVGSEVWITVTDNGIGMRPELVRALLRMEPVSESEPGRETTGIGVRNVFKRLQLFAGPGDWVDIESEVGVGTSITLKLPARREDTDVPLIDRG